MAKISDALKTIFFIILILQFAPPILENLYNQYSRLFELRTKVALLEINDEIRSSTYFTNYLRKFFENQEIKAIVLKINSGGGAGGSGQAIFNEIQLLQKKYPKPILTISETVLGSAAYYIASATNWIITAPSTLVGSIGGSLPHQFKFREFIEQWKIHVDFISAGKYKNLGDLFTDSTPEGQALLQSLADDAYAQFTNDIANARKLSLQKSSEWAEGKIFTGNQALKQGLVDEIGSWSNVIEWLKSKALIEGKIDWVKPPKKNPLQEFFGASEEQTSEGNITGFMPSLINSCCAVLEHRYSNKQQF